MITPNSSIETNLSNMSLIAGPCSAETREQVDTTARFLKDQGVEWFRAGLWKPRSGPGLFQGKGEEAVDWIEQASKEYKLKAMVEVYKADQVELVTEKGLQGIWIGARTTTNPFIVEEICEALDGSKLDVFIKNPLAPDLKLWKGTLERFLKSNHRGNVHFIHRGFATYAQSGFRNSPLWDLPLAIKNEYSHLKMYCDPSHIAGKRDFISTISQLAINLKFDGLMIEVHPEPEKALSDSGQQLSFKQFESLIRDLKSPNDKILSEEEQEELLSVRETLAQLDQTILDLIRKRKYLVKDISRFKKNHNLSFYNPEQFNKMLQIWRDRSNKDSFDAEEAERIYRLLHSFSLEWQAQTIQD